MPARVSLWVSAVFGVVALATYELEPTSSLAIIARVVCGAALAFAAFARAERRADAIAIGVLLASIADALLACSASSPKLFVPAMGIFAAGHGAFMKGLWSRAPADPLRAVATLLPLALYAVFVVGILWDSLGALRVPVVVYVAMLTMMCWRAVLAAQAPGAPRVTLALAGLLFVLGDTALAINKFKTPLPHPKLLALAPYWSSLGAFALAVVSPRTVVNRNERGHTAAGSPENAGE